MEELHNFRVVAWWASGRAGIAKSSSAPNAIHFTTPPAFGGLEGRWTPEDLLLSAVASCFTTTFRAVAEHSKFEYTDLQVEVEGAICKGDSGYVMGKVTIRPSLTIADEADKDRALKLLNKAQSLCPVGRALLVEKKFQPLIRVSEVRPTVALPVSV